jgi:phenylacetate-CoA ligase
VSPTPHSERYWSEVETWSREEIAARQLESLQRQVSYVYDHSDYYRRQWDELGF